MNKTIRINDIKDVQVGDMLFVKGCSDGFRVAGVLANSLLFPVAVDNPFADSTSCVSSDRFDHAERTVEEPEWPDPHDLKLHVYLGADGRRYILNPCSEQDTCPWTVENSTGFYSRQRMAHIFQGALPLTELMLVTKEEES